MMISGSARFNHAMAELKRRTGNGDDYKLRDAVIDEVEALQADNARLRALVKESEWHAGDREGWCQFCGSLPDGADGMASDDRHSPDCRAFTPDGVVK